jgi:hypothetical protein
MGQWIGEEVTTTEKKMDKWATKEFKEESAERH